MSGWGTGARPGVCVLAVLVALGLGACGGDSPQTPAGPPPPAHLADLRQGGGESIVTPKQATQITRSAFVLGYRALEKTDMRLVRSVFDGPALEATVASLRDYRFKSPGPLLHPISAVTVLVPWQHRYPAYFLGQVRTTGFEDQAGKLVYQFFVMRRMAPDQPWKVALQIAAGPDPVEGMPDPAHRGYTLVTRGTWVQPREVHPMLAAYWNYWRDQRKPPPGSRFHPGTWTTEFGAGLAANGRPGPDRIVSWSTSFALPAEDPVFVFAAEEPWTIACSAVRAIQRQRAADPSALQVQPSSRDKYGALVPPGHHRIISYYYVRQSCIYVGTPEFKHLAVVGGNPGTVDGWPGVGYRGHPKPAQRGLPPYYPMPRSAFSG